MATEKTKKKAKLRHAEYYDFQQIQDELYADSMRHPVEFRSIEYNDNRLSLYSAQMGKCAVTGKVLEIGDIFCHHKTPRHCGGTDKYQNLILVCGKVHNLIHATNPETIAKYEAELNLDAKQHKKLTELKNLVSVESC